MTSTRGESKCGNWCFEREVVDRYAASEEGQDSSSILVNREQEFPVRCEVEMGDILSVGRRESI